MSEGGIVSKEGSYIDQLQGRLSGAGLRIAVISARFNGHVTGLMRDRCLETLVEHHCDEGRVDDLQVPGAFELPQAAARLVATGRYDAVVALGCVIRGETPHFDFVAGEAARGLGQVAARGEVPVVFGVLTTETEAQALERARPAPEGQDKGREAALAALEMAHLFRRIGS
jgi:6,7-dimethyl-8-ribityllumazine synthase